MRLVPVVSRLCIGSGIFSRYLLHVMIHIPLPLSTWNNIIIKVTFQFPVQFLPIMACIDAA